METFIYIIWAVSLVLHILLNLVIRDIVCKDEFGDTQTLPRFTFVPLFLAIITLWWKPGGHPAENKKTLKLMKAANYTTIAFVASSLLVLLFIA